MFSYAVSTQSCLALLPLDGPAEGIIHAQSSCSVSLYFMMLSTPVTCLPVLHHRPSLLTGAIKLLPCLLS